MFKKIYSFVILLPLLFIISCEEESNPYLVRTTEKYPDHGYLWVANSQDNTVSCIDRFADTVIGTYKVGPNPSRTAVDLEGNCWVGSRDDGTVYFVTPKGFTKKYSGFNYVRGVALDKDGNVWVANSITPNSLQKFPTIQKIDVKSDSVYAPVSISGVTNYFYGALVDANGFLWVLDQNSKMFRINIKNFPNLNQTSDIKTVSLPGCYGFTIDMNNFVWVSGYQVNSIYKIDPDSVKVVKTYQVPSNFWGGWISGVTFDINNNIWISNYFYNSALKLNQFNDIISNHPINGYNPHGIAADDRGFVYTINRGGTISKLDCVSGNFIKSYTVGRDPYTYSDLTGFIYRKVTLKYYR